MLRVTSSNTISQVRQTWNVDVRVDVDVKSHPAGHTTDKKTLAFFGTQNAMCSQELFFYFLLIDFWMRVSFQPETKCFEDNLCWYLVEYLSPGGEMLHLLSRIRLRFVFAEPAYWTVIGCDVLSQASRERHRGCGCNERHQDSNCVKEVPFNLDLDQSGSQNKNTKILATAQTSLLLLSPVRLLCDDVIVCSWCVVMFSTAPSLFSNSLKVLSIKVTEKATASRTDKHVKRAKTRKEKIEDANSQTCTQLTTQFCTFLQLFHFPCQLL